MLDYYKMICRSPEGFKKGEMEALSVPIGISFGDEEFKPWTKDTHRFHFYNQPIVETAEPSEIKIGKMGEIYVFTADGSSFTQRKFFHIILFSGAKPGRQWGSELQF